MSGGKPRPCTEAVDIPSLGRGVMHEQHRGGRRQSVRTKRNRLVTAASIAAYVALRVHETATATRTAIEAAP